MKQRPWGCDILLSNPPYARAMEVIEHAFKCLLSRSMSKVLSPKISQEPKVKFPSL